MINNVVLCGRLTRDPELKKTQSGQSILNFTLAINRQFTNQNGERDTDFINCVVWGKIAENTSRFVGKGSMIGVEGRIQSRNYDGNDGKRVYVTEVLCQSVQFLEPRSSREPTLNNGKNQNVNVGFYESEPNFPSANQNFFQIPDVDLDEQFGKHPSTIDISDDDVPF